jgi:MarR family transcriptional regulator, 2-MHQ and catechol-resistance regulon repressor
MTELIGHKFNCLKRLYKGACLKSLKFSNLHFLTNSVIILISKYLIWRYSMPTHYRGNPETVLALDTYIKFTRAANALETSLTKKGAFGGLTPSQFGVLETLFHLGPLCAGEISAKLLKSGGNITLVLDNLEKQGLVQRTNKPDDRRARTIVLTSTGRELIAHVFPEVAAAIENEFSILPAQEQIHLGKICRALGKQEAIIAELI